MKACELCDRAARMHCESDQASLCWECDAKVHGANFLVARHARVLLCRRCQAPTPWRASGERLSPIISACDRCTAIEKQDEEDDFDGDDTDMDEEDQEDCQVVPWRPTPPPPPTESSSSGEESSSPSPGKASSGFLKRIRENADLGAESDASCPFSQRSRLDQSIQVAFPLQFADDENAIHSSAGSFRPANDRRRSFLQSDAPLSADLAGTGSRVCARRASDAVDIVSSASCSRPI